MATVFEPTPTSTFEPVVIAVEADEAREIARAQFGTGTRVEGLWLLHSATAAELFQDSYQALEGRRDRAIWVAQVSYTNRGFSCHAGGPTPRAHPVERYIAIDSSSGSVLEDFLFGLESSDARIDSAPTAPVDRVASGAAHATRVSMPSATPENTPAPPSGLADADRSIGATLGTYPLWFGAHWTYAQRTETNGRAPPAVSHQTVTITVGSALTVAAYTALIRLDRWAAIPAFPSGNRRMVVPR